jgi:hypothetical protein
MLLVKLSTLLRSTDDEWEVLERHIINELRSGLYSCGTNSMEGVTADST